MLYIDMYDNRYSFNGYYINKTIIIDDKISYLKTNEYLSGNYNEVMYKLYRIKVKDLFNFNLLDNIIYHKYRNKEVIVIQLWGKTIHDIFINRYFGNRFILNGYRLYSINNFNFSHFIKNDKYEDIITDLRRY